MEQSVAIVIVNWNTKDYLRRCLASVLAACPDASVWVVDNASTDGSVEMIAVEFPTVHRVLNYDNVGFAKANNQALAQIREDYVLLLNPDAAVNSGTLERALEAMRRRPEIGLLGVRLENDDGTLQHSCFRFPSPGINCLEATGAYKLLPTPLRGRLLLSGYWNHDQERAVDWVMGAFMLVRRSALLDVGLLPEEYFIFTEDMEWCYRFWQRGWKVWFLPSASVIHSKNKSGEQLPSEWRVRTTHEGKYRFCREHYGHTWTKVIQVADWFGCILRERWLARRRGEEDSLVKIFKQDRSVIASIVRNGMST